MTRPPHASAKPPLASSVQVRTACALLGLVALSGSLLAQEKPTLVVGAKVFDGTGAFREGVQVLIQDGKVLELGADLAAPADHVVVDVAGLWVTPGLVDANTSLGLPQAHENEESSEVTPQVRARDAIDPKAQAFGRALRGGVTTAYVSPGGRNVFGGLGLVLKTAGPDLATRVLREEEGLRMTLGNMPASGNRPFRGSTTSMYTRRPGNRMGVIWEIRKAFYDAMKARETGADLPVEIARKTRVLVAALDRKIPVRTTARQGQDIRTALRLAEEFGIEVVLDEAVEAWQALDYIVAAKVTVVASPPSLANAADGATPHEDNLALLSNAGVPVAIQTGQGLGALPLVREATFAVRGGMKREKALEAVTSVPAKILRVADRVGSLEPGHDADLVVWSRHPLSPGSRALRVFVDGIDAVATSAARPGGGAAASEKETKR